MPSATPTGNGVGLGPMLDAISSLFCTCSLIWHPLCPALITFGLDFGALFSILLIKEASLWLRDEDFIVVPI